MGMGSYISDIQRHEKELNLLHQKLNEAVKARHISQSRKEHWQAIAYKFRNYRTCIDDWLDEIENNNICDWEDARAFTRDYLQTDPMYFRSGYTKEMLIKKLKPCDLTDAECEILREVILKRIYSGALREFKKYCQLMPRIQNREFIGEINKLSTVANKNVSRRAKFAKNYIRTN